MKIQRFIRVLVYEGSPDAIQSAIAGRGVKGSRKFNAGIQIREAIIGDFLEQFDPPEVESHLQELQDISVQCTYKTP